jgi:hypothetical protein
MCRGRALGTVPWFAPVRPFSHRLAMSRRGGLRTPVTTALASRRIFPLRVPASRARIRCECNASALVWPCHADAQSASLREKGPWHRPLVCPRKAFFASLGHLAEGRAPHARNDGTTPTLPPFGHRFIVNACGGNEMSRRTYGLATRARRPRPSEKSALHIIPGPFPARPSDLGASTPRRGGLRTPVKERSGLAQTCPH